MSTGDKKVKRSWVNSHNYHTYGINPVDGTSEYDFHDSYTDSMVTTAPETWVGEDRLDYRTVIRDGGNATNEYFATKVKYELAPYVFTQNSVQRQYYQATPESTPSWVGRYFHEAQDRQYSAPTDPGPGTFSAKAENSAARAFTREVRKAHAEAQALVSAGEFRETVRLVLGARRNVFNRLRAFQNSAKKQSRNMRTEKSRKKAVANAWLEYSFGWVPLISDTQNLARAAAKTLYGSARSWSVRGNGRDTDVLEEGEAPVTGGLYASVPFTCKQRTVTTGRCYYYGKVRLQSSGLPSLSTNFGLTMDNWIPTIWELIPWSFAIDYFTGFGDFISSLTAPWSSMQYIGRTQVVEVRREFYDMHQLVPEIVESEDASNTRRATPGKGQVVNTSVSRQRVVNVIAAPELRVPGYKNAYLNLAALATLRSNNRL